MNYPFDISSMWGQQSLFLLISLFNFLYIFVLDMTEMVDIKPANMEELTEVITAAEFHPIECNTFVYSSSKGAIKVADMRSAALCDTQAKGIWIERLCYYVVSISCMHTYRTNMEWRDLLILYTNSL